MAYLLIAFPLLMAAVTFAAPSDRHRPWLLPLGAGVQLGLVFWAIAQAGQGTEIAALENWLLLDALGKVVLGFLAVLFFICAFMRRAICGCVPTGPTASSAPICSSSWP